MRTISEGARTVKLQGLEAEAVGGTNYGDDGGELDGGREAEYLANADSSTSSSEGDKVVAFTTVASACEEQLRERNVHKLRLLGMNARAGGVRC